MSQVCLTNTDFYDISKNSYFMEFLKAYQNLHYTDYEVLLKSNYPDVRIKESGAVFDISWELEVELLSYNVDIDPGVIIRKWQDNEWVEFDMSPAQLLGKLWVMSHSDHRP